MGQSWADLKDEDLLKLRICELELRIEETPVQSRVERLKKELTAKNLALAPKVYLGDEWFSPEGMLAIAVPFYLAHPRLIALERKLMLEVEGEDEAYFMRLLRHEAGHCFDHGYGFSKRRRWRELFGSPDVEYAPETYRPRPYSRSFVKNLQNWYAQSHPDEDFAETFAVWLHPESDWKIQYAPWSQALSKLRYVDELAKSVKGREPNGVGGYLPFSATKMRTTLGSYYSRRRREQADAYPDFFDEDLKTIFNGERSLSRREYGAAGFMNRHRKQIVATVSHWTRERKYTVNGLVRKLTARCENLDLKVGKTEAQTSLEVASYLATLVTHYLFTGKFK